MNNRRRFGIKDNFSCEDCRKVLETMKNNLTEQLSDEHIAKTMVHTLKCKGCREIFIKLRGTNTDRSL